MRLDEIMSTKVRTVGPDQSAARAWSQMQEHGIRHLVVAERRKVVGVISERDLGGRRGAQVRRNCSVRDLMSAPVKSAAPGTTLRQAANLMRSRLVGCLPVVDGGRIVGSVTATDVLDELGRGAARPTVGARRRTARMPPAGLRQAVRRARRPGRVHGSGAR
jgi:acetoin utilization protein AcuB